MSLHLLGEHSRELELLPDAEDLMGGLMAEAPDNVSHVRRLGILRAMQGNRNAAEEISARLAAWEGPLQDGVASVWRAEIAAQLGDSNRAVRLLRQAMEEGWRVKDSPHWDVFLKPFRGYPPFGEFVRPKGVTGPSRPHLLDPTEEISPVMT